MVKKNNKTIIITGMHRSGTSLLASILQRAGLNIGEKLLPAYKDNIKGYFEDIDFIDFNRKIIKKNKTNMFISKKLFYENEDIQELNKLIREKSKFGLFGWKDPRNTLSLDFYNKYVPKPFFVFVFRHPFLVVDSLIRRGTDKCIKINPFIAARSWINYNNRILDFIENHSNYILIDLNQLSKFPRESVSSINNKANIQLNSSKVEGVFDEKIIRKDFIFRNLKTRIVLFVYRQKLLDGYKKLLSQSKNESNYS